MTSKSDFTSEEWFLIHSTPALVGSVVLMADKSGFIGTAKETFAISKEMVAGAQAHPQNAIIQAIVREKTGPDGEPVKDSYKDFKQEIKDEATNIEQLKAEVLENCGKVATLLAEKVTADEAEEYTNWVLDIAQKVAEAAKEKSSKGTGQGRVSIAEETAIAEIRSALKAE